MGFPLLVAFGPATVAAGAGLGAGAGARAGAGAGVGAPAGTSFSPLRPRKKRFIFVLWRELKLDEAGMRLPCPSKPCALFELGTHLEIASSRRGERGWGGAEKDRGLGGSAGGLRAVQDADVLPSCAVTQACPTWNKAEPLAFLIRRCCGALDSRSGSPAWSVRHAGIQLLWLQRFGVVKCNGAAGLELSAVAELSVSCQTSTLETPTTQSRVHHTCNLHSNSILLCSKTFSQL